MRQGIRKEQLTLADVKPRTADSQIGAPEVPPWWRLSESRERQPLRPDNAAATFVTRVGIGAGQANCAERVILQHRCRPLDRRAHVDRSGVASATECVVVADRPGDADRAGPGNMIVAPRARLRRAKIKLPVPVAPPLKVMVVARLDQTPRWRLRSASPHRRRLGHHRH